LGSVLFSRLGVSGKSGNAVGLNTEAISAHLHLEEAVDTPVGSPRVTSPPEAFLELFIVAVSGDGDLVVDHGEADLLGVDSVVLGGIVSEEGIGNVDSARDRAVSGDLSLHLVSTSHAVVIADVVSSGRGDGPAFVLTILSSGWWGPGAVLAGSDGRDLSLEVVGNVLLASSVDESFIMGVLVNLSGVTSIARATSLSVDNDLGVNRDGGGG